MNRKIMQVRDLFAMRAHLGWAHALLSRAHDLNYPGASAVRPLVSRALERFDRHTQSRSRNFDRTFATETYGGLEVRVSGDRDNQQRWGYAAINQDFFREIITSIPAPLAPYCFVDVGSGKGAAIFMAGDHAFRRLLGVELTPELVDIARRNTLAYNRAAARPIAPEWVVGDFFAWDIPDEPQLFFFNNPFPEALTLAAIQKVEHSLAEHPRPALLVFRKAPRSTGDHLHRSPAWKPLRLAPYWRVYQATGSTRNTA